MPYEIETRDGIVLRNIPDNMREDDPRLKALVARERNERRSRSPEFQAKVAAQTEEDRARYDPTEGMGVGEKVLANLGAGFASFGRGARQIIPGLKAPTEEEVKEARERDKRLAQSTETGVGADWLPSAGQALQFAGEVAPSLAIPAGAATGTAARILPRALQATLRTPVRAGATGGAVSGAFMPTTEEESRAMNIGLGAAGGAALPGAVSLARGAGRYRTPRSRAAEQLVSELGEDAPQIPARVAARTQARAGTPQAVEAIPETLAEATGSTRAAQLERRTGAGSPEAAADASGQWADFRRLQNEARYGAFQEATREGRPGIAEAAERVRENVTGPLRRTALARAGTDPWFHVPVRDALDTLMRSEAGVDPAVRKVVDLVRSAIDQRANQAITPERLYRIRKLLVDKLQGPVALGDDLGAAVRSADREVMGIVNAIDDALDVPAQGRWGTYRTAYQRTSRPVAEAQGARLARESIDPEGVHQLGEAPIMTLGRVNRAVSASEGPGGRRFPLTLSQRAREGLGGLQEHMRRAGEVEQARAAAGTPGGGSRTSRDFAAMVPTVAGAVMGAPVELTRIALTALGNRASTATRQELVRLLQNPQEAARAIQAAQAARQPLSEAQSALLQALSVGAAAPALPAAMQQP